MRRLTRVSHYLTGPSSLRYLNPHLWKGLPADQVFELHDERVVNMGQRYNPNDAERLAVLSTVLNLSKEKSPLEYVYALDHFKERIMTDTPSRLRGLPAKKSNILVKSKGETPFESRRAENLHRISAYEMPLLAKLRKPYEPASDMESPLKIKYFTDFSNSSEEAFNSRVELSVLVDDLGLTDKQKHKFKVLLGNKMNLDTGVLKIKCQSHPTAAQNVREVVSKFGMLLLEVKDPAQDDFSDIVLDRRHMRDAIKKPRAEFPEAWKRPQDAPVQTHNVVRLLVDRVKAKKDDIHLSQFIA